MTWKSKSQCGNRRNENKPVRMNCAVMCGSIQWFRAAMNSRNFGFRPVQFAVGNAKQ